MKVNQWSWNLEAENDRLRQGLAKLMAREAARPVAERASAGTYNTAVCPLLSLSQRLFFCLSETANVVRSLQSRVASAAQAETETRSKLKAMTKQRNELQQTLLELHQEVQYSTVYFTGHDCTVHC